jgi:endonuclease YncB( thermonuclease family)
MHSKLVTYIVFSLIITFILTFPAYSQTITGRVIKISDGDTLTIIDQSKNQIKIRLAEIDTPESRQPYGNKSKQELSRLCFGKDVTIQVQTKDRYGRTVGRIYVDRLDVNAEMIRLGAAWVIASMPKTRRSISLRTRPERKRRGCGHCLNPKGCRPGNGARLNVPAGSRSKRHQAKTLTAAVKQDAAKCPVAKKPDII